uniref:transcription intermediary factor 1-alpha-like isoform X2 n=1 Tax=Gasterosteus aculeatus aculeatus TaxID=481459 RepID=UPI001A99D588|nr:transcription intermediary factor 1-alpha-like isoform X2 [Gasterosteus aculeatus aculeatus]
MIRRREGCEMQVREDAEGTARHLVGLIEQQMDGCVDERDTARGHDAENEAESMQVREEKSGATGQKHLDTCPVCRLNFHSREPKLLPCLHSFCKKCLPAPWRNLAAAEPLNSPRPLNVMRCPVCRQECMEVDVMENVFVKDSVEAPSSTVERAVQLCMTCDDNTEAVGFCVDCVEYLCSTCVEAHHRVKFTKDHTIRQKAEIMHEVHGASPQRQMFCNIHKQEPLKLFCETCDLLTCRDCQLVKHKDHNYQFLEDAYKSHKQHMENMTHQLQEKKKHIEEISNSINKGLLQVDQNRTSVHDELKKSICSLILEINKKGKMLANQLEAVTKDHESVLRKQQEDIGYLSRHLDHVIHFTKWATARSGGTALLYSKRLILFQIGNLLRAKCSSSFIPQSTVRFHSRASYWASNVDLGSLVAESVPGNQPGGFQGIPHQLSHPGPPSGSAHSFALGAPHDTLTQLQMQVDKLTPQGDWQPRPPPPPRSWYQSVRLQPTVPGPPRGGGSPSLQPARRLTGPPPNRVSPTSSLASPEFTPQPLRGMGGGSIYQPKAMDVFSPSPPYAHGGSSPQSRQTMEPTYVRNDPRGPVYVLKPNYPHNPPPALHHRSVQGEQNSPGYAAASQEEKPGTVTWKPPETQQAGGAVGSAVKKRRRSSPVPIIVIKDEPDEDSSYVQSKQRSSLPDSTGDQPPISTGAEPHSRPPPPSSPRDQRGGARPPAPLDDPTGGWCAACHTGGQLLCCHKCARLFHLWCHVPTLLKYPSGEWLCSLCRDPLAPEMEYDCQDEAGTEKKEAGFSPVDKRKCEKLLLRLFCSKLSSASPGPGAPWVCANNWPAIKGTTNLSAVKERLEANQTPCYRSPAHFVSDIRLRLGNGSALSEVDTQVTAAGRRLKELFEEQLGIVFPEQTFPETKLERIPAGPPDSQLLSLDNIIQRAKRQRTCSDSQDAPSRPSGAEGTNLLNRSDI